ncbi:MAG: DUF1080 domain-containing protein [Planctomycetota bacterium]
MRSSILLVLTLAAPRALAQDVSPDALAKHVERLATFEVGSSRTDLVALEAAGRAGDGTERALLERLYLDLLAKGCTDDARTFVLEQLEIVGGAASVEPLGALLTEKACTAQALDVVESVDRGAALQAVRAAVDVGGGDRAVLLRALGRIGEVADLDRLFAAARDASSPDRLLAIVAFGESARGCEYLPRLLRSLPAEAPVRDLVEDALLSACRRVDVGGARTSSALEGLQFVVATTRSSTTRSRALAELARLRPDAATAPLLLELASEDLAAAGAAAGVLARSTATDVSALVERALVGLEPDARRLAIDVLARRGDAVALEGLRRFVTSNYAGEAPYAVRAIGRVGSDPAVGLLVDLAGALDERGAAAREALAASRVPGVDERIEADVRDASKDADDGGVRRAGLLRVLAARGGAKHTELYLSHAADASDPLFDAAWDAIESSASGSSAVATVERLANVDDADALPRCGRATAAVVARGGASQEIANAVLDAFDGSDTAHRRALVPSLAAIGGEGALQRVGASLADGELSGAAIDACANWRDAAAADLLVATYASAQGEDRARCMDAVVTLLRRVATSDTDGASRAIERLAAAGPVGDDAQRLLELAADVPHRASAAYVRSVLDRDDAGAELDASAVRSAVALAPRLGPADRYVAEDLLARALTHCRAKKDLDAVLAAIDSVERDEDFLIAWRVSGPYTRAGLGGGAVLGTVFPPETDPDAEGVRWSDLPLSAMTRTGVFDLNADGVVSNAATYARTKIWSDAAQRVRLEIGSDDGAAAWLNGREVWRNDVMRGLSVGEDVFEVDLAAGWNELLLKISQGGGDFGFCCRLRGPDRRAARGWRQDSIERGTAPPPGAIVLFDGVSNAAFQRQGGGDAGWTVVDGALECVPGSGNVESRESFGDQTLHVEFQVPDEPELERGQGQGNSGVYLQGRYEVQVLNSWGMPPHPNECGSIYGVRAPDVNMSARPGEWQTYDIEFTAARWKGGRKVSDARLTVFHNGVLVHDDVAVPGSTGAGSQEREGDGPLVLQDHGHRLRYRNVWVLPHDRSASEEGFVPLFDPGAADPFAGWTRRGGAAEYLVEGDQLVGETRPNQPNTFLCTDRDHGDFVLEYEFLIDEELNSGVQIRSHAYDAYLAGRVHGYQIEIDPAERAWSCGVYDESRRGWLAQLDELEEARDAFRHGEWNAVRVMARGDVIRTWLNGVPCAVLVDGMDPTGFVGLQVHGMGGREEPLRVRWRNLRLREL